MVRREAGQPSKNPLKTLHDEGQTVWLDFLSRSFLAGDGLKRLIERDGLTGVTSNPSILSYLMIFRLDSFKGRRPQVGITRKARTTAGRCQRSVSSAAQL